MSNNNNWRFEHPPYGYPPYWGGPPSVDPVDPVTQIEHQMANLERMKKFFREDKPKDKDKEEKKVLGLSEKDIKWVLLLTAPLTGFLMSKFYVTLLTSWPTLPHN